MLRYVYCFLLFFVFRVVRIRRRRKVYFRYLISDEFLVTIWYKIGPFDSESYSNTDLQQFVPKITQTWIVGF